MEQLVPGTTPPDAPVEGEEEQLDEVRSQDVADHRDHHFYAHLVEPLIVVVLVHHSDIRVCVAEYVVY